MEIKEDTDIDSLYCQILRDVLKMLEEKEKNNLLHYAIGWRSKSNDEIKFSTVTSYFSGNSFSEIMEKFYFEKNEKDIIIDSIALLPDS